MLTRWIRVARRIRVPAGFLFAAFYLWRARPSAASLAWSLLLVVPGLLLRAYASGYVKKNAELTVTGPYGYTRNPLYAPTIYGEEQFLRSTFPAFESYAQRVPRLLPRLTPAAFPGDGSFSGTLYRQHHEYNSLLGACAVYIVLVAALWLRH
jgi:protein-S-isoprenylcysteine O-methyltransferase Ste14